MLVGHFAQLIVADGVAYACIVPYSWRKRLDRSGKIFIFLVGEDCGQTQKRTATLKLRKCILWECPFRKKKPPSWVVKLSGVCFLDWITLSAKCYVKRVQNSSERNISGHPTLELTLLTLPQNCPVDKNNLQREWNYCFWASSSLGTEWLYEIRRPLSVSHMGA